MAGMTCCKPGERSRLIYAIREYRGRKDEPKGFGWKAADIRPGPQPDLHRLTRSVAAAATAAVTVAPATAVVATTTAAATVVVGRARRRAARMA